MPKNPALFADVAQLRLIAQHASRVVRFIKRNERLIRIVSLMFTKLARVQIADNRFR